MAKLKQYFITGLVLVVPVYLTLAVLGQLFLFVDNILGKFVTGALREHLGVYIPGVGLVLFILLIFIVGFFASKFLRNHPLFIQIERWFTSLPLVKSIYPTAKQIVNFISQQKEFGFKRVVLVQYPSKGIWTMGFLTNEHLERFNAAAGRELVSVLIPSVPNPLTGFVIFVPKEEVISVDIDVKDAIKVCISGGVVQG